MNPLHSDSYNSSEHTRMSIEERVKQIECLMAEMNQRNDRVDLNKKWETSATRFLSVAAITYVTVNLILLSIGDPHPPIHALVPTFGYMLSTLSLQRLKIFWINFEIGNKGS